MHEVSIAESLVDLIEAEALTAGFARVRRVRLQLGALGSVEPDALLFCFPAVAHGTVAAGARLDIETIPGAGWCAQCRCTVALTQRYDLCPACRRGPVTLTAGDELRLAELEVE